MNKIKKIFDILMIILIYALYPIISMMEFYYRRNWRFVLYGIMTIPLYIIVITIMRNNSLETPHYILKIISVILYLIGVLLQTKLISIYYQSDQKINHLPH